MRAAIDTRWKICAGAPATALILFAGCSSGVSAVNQTAPPVVTPAATVIYLVDKANNDIDQFSTTEDGAPPRQGR